MQVFQNRERNRICNVVWFSSKPYTFNIVRTMYVDSVQRFLLKIKRYCFSLFERFFWKFSFPLIFLNLLVVTINIPEKVCSFHINNFCVNHFAALCVEWQVYKEYLVKDPQKEVITLSYKQPADLTLFSRELY